MHQVEVERILPHPIDTVFARYTDHAGWSDWAGLGPVHLVRRGAPERDGAGAVRAFTLAPGLREEVTRLAPPEQLEYRIIQGALPLADHRGEVRFETVGEGTRVTWRVSFRSRVPGLGWPLERGLTLLFRRILAALERDLDARRAR